jgi:hypothetical protein
MCSSATPQRAAHRHEPLNFFWACVYCLGRQTRLKSKIKIFKNQKIENRKIRKIEIGKSRKVQNVKTKFPNSAAAIPPIRNPRDSREAGRAAPIKNAIRDKNV